MPFDEDCRRKSHQRKCLDRVTTRPPGGLVLCIDQSEQFPGQNNFGWCPRLTPWTRGVPIRTISPAFPAPPRTPYCASISDEFPSCRLKSLSLNALVDNVRRRTESTCFSFATPPEHFRPCPNRIGNLRLYDVPFVGPRARRFA